MRTSWKQVCAKLKMNGVTGDARRGGSDESVTSDDTTVTSSGTPRRQRLDNEWQMNYMIVNRNDGLFVSRVVESFFYGVRLIFGLLSFATAAHACFANSLLRFKLQAHSEEELEAWKEVIHSAEGRGGGTSEEADIQDRHKHGEVEAFGRHQEVNHGQDEEAARVFLRPDRHIQDEAVQGSVD